MTALSDAAQAVEEAAEAVLWDSNRVSIRHLIAAVRRHDAAIVLADPDARKYGRGQWAADRINPKETR